MNIRPVKSGWAAYGDGWAVHGKTKEEAIAAYHEAVSENTEIDARPIQLAEEKEESEK
jgi:hypothetical protein